MQNAYTFTWCIFGLALLKDEEIAPVLTSLISLASSHLFKCSLESSSSTRSYFHFTPAAIRNSSHKPNRFDKKAKEESDLVLPWTEPLARQALFTSQEKCLFILGYKSSTSMLNTTLPSAGAQVWQCRNCPRCSARAARLEPSRRIHNCCPSARAAPMPPQATSLKQREKAATDWVDWSSLEVGQDLEKNNRNFAWPGALINRRKPLGSPSVPLSIRAPHGILSWGC